MKMLPIGYTYNTVNLATPSMIENLIEVSHNGARFTTTSTNI